MSNEQKVRITLTKSPIGYKKKQRVTVETLGLRKLHSSVTHTATPQIKGMINKISHLVSVEEVEE